MHAWALGLSCEAWRLWRSRNWPKSKKKTGRSRNWPESTTTILQRSGSTKSRSPIITFVVTRPPAFRHTLTTLLSIARPRPAKTPARAHAARWWPQESNGRPHRQERAVKGRGRPRQRKKTTLNNWGEIFVSLLVGHVDNANPAPSPPWDLTKDIWLRQLV